jgi:phasin family protein
MDIVFLKSLADFLNEVKENDPLGWEQIQTAVACLDEITATEGGMIETDDVVVGFHVNGDQIFLTNVCFKHDEEAYGYALKELIAFGQANLEAFAEVGLLWRAGVQELTKQMAAVAMASFDESIAAMTAISTAKSVKEAVDIQTNYAKSAFEKAMVESNKLTDESIRFTERMLRPITSRMSPDPSDSTH